MSKTTQRTPLPREESTLKATRLVRKPFVVTGIQITAENMTLAARWCKGDILTHGENSFIRVPAGRYARVEKTEAYIGCWVVRSRYRNKLVFKVYTDEQLHMMFSILEMDEELEADAVEILEDEDDEAQIPYCNQKNHRLFFPKGISNVNFKAS